MSTWLTHNVSRQRGRVGEGLSASSSSGSDTAALVSHDPRTARLREEHEVMDYLHWQLLSVLLDPHWEHGVPAAVDVALLGRFHERFADHAVEIGRRVVFMVTGALPRRRTSAPTERRTPGRPPGPWRSRSLRRPKRRTARDLPTPLDPAPGWLDLRPGRVLHGSATPSASPSRLGVPARPSFLTSVPKS
jgi:hypothetical protein